MNTSNKMSCKNAIAVFNSPNVKGTVRFHQCVGENGVVVVFYLHNLPPNKTYAIHIHQYGDERDGCKSLGGHWNPLGAEHGSIAIDINNSHAGDLINNLTANNKGEFQGHYYDPRLQIRGDINESIVGRSVVIHDGVDDLGLGNNKESKITGNAGGRMTCAIIGQSKTNIPS